MVGHFPELILHYPKYVGDRIHVGRHYMMGRGLWIKSPWKHLYGR